MKSYKKLAEETRVRAIIQQGDRDTKDLDSVVDSWLAFMERDAETPEAEKAAQYQDMAERLEKEMGRATARELLNLTFCYVAIRQKLEPMREGETEARTIHVAP